MEPKVEEEGNAFCQDFSLGERAEDATRRALALALAPTSPTKMRVPLPLPLATEAAARGKGITETQKDSLFRRALPSATLLLA